MPIHIEFSDAGDGSKGDGLLPVQVFDSRLASQTMTPTGSSVTSTAAAPAMGGRAICMISNSDATVAFIAIGQTPNAATTTQRAMILPGMTRAFGCVTGDKVAVVNV